MIPCRQAPSSAARMTSDTAQSLGKKWAQLNHRGEGQDIRTIVGAVEQAVQAPVLRRGLQIYGALTLEYLERLSPENADPTPMAHILPFVELLKELILRGEPTAAERTAKGISHILSHAYGEGSLDAARLPQQMRANHGELLEPLSTERITVKQQLAEAEAEPPQASGGLQTAPLAKLLLEELVEQVAPTPPTTTEQVGVSSVSILLDPQRHSGPQQALQGPQPQQVVAPEVACQIAQSVPFSRPAVMYARKRRRRQQHLQQQQALQELVQEAQGPNGDSAWLRMLESIRSLPTNNGGPTLDRIKRAIQMLEGNEPMRDIREMLETAISLRVYRSNSAGATKKMALAALDKARKRLGGVLEEADIGSGLSEETRQSEKLETEEP